MGDKNINVDVQRSVRESARKRLNEYISRFNKAKPDNPLCRKCMACYKTDHGGYLWPQCKLSTDTQLKLDELEGRMEQLSEEDQMIYKFSKDPVLWARLMFNYKARWYQEDLLRCSSPKKVVRMGRRSGKTDALAVKILHCAWTKPDKNPGERYTVLVICPYERQVSLVFDRIREFIAMNDDLKNSIDRDVSNPQRIEFTNMATIVGIPAGVRTGAKADQVRGQDADFLALDEADYLDQGSIESIMAIYASNPGCILWASSTPTGARNFFYEWCIKKTLGFKEFHYPSSVSPTWTPEIEMMFRQTYTDAAFAREFLAEFGEEDAGVFQHKYIQMSFENYDLDDCKPRPNTLKVMGVDWNSTGSGTHIVITEYDTDTDKFRLVCKEIVDVSEFTQQKGVDRIIRLDQKWNCDFIYVDAGFGSTQVELLHKFGMEHPKSGLAQKVKAIEFGSKTQIRDPYSKQLIKKHTKPLIVELAARRVESLQCVFPEDEDYPRGLIGQMRGFVVEKYGRDGSPIYSQGEDHTLVAWMLSIFGLIMEYTDIQRAIHACRVRFVNRKNVEERKIDEPGSTMTGERTANVFASPRWVENTGPSNDRTLNRLGHAKTSQRQEKRSRLRQGLRAFASNQGSRGMGSPNRRLF